MRRLVALFFLTSVVLLGQDHRVEPTWLHRDLATLHEHQTDLTTDSCHYTPIFGEGDTETTFPLSVARFGLLSVDPHGACRSVSYPKWEELYFVRQGTGSLRYDDESRSLVANDFTYLPPAVPHSVSNTSDQPFHLVIATVKLPAGTALAQPPKLVVANLSELREQTVSGHPSSVQYKLLIGPRGTARDRISAAYNVADFFLMDFAPGGTNFPHHHENAEEIYLVLDGEGQMAAGGGIDGIEGLHSAKPQDAYYFRPNCTVGFYNQNTSNAKAHILAVRAYVPVPKNLD